MRKSISLKEYKPGTTFPSVIGRTVSESEPACPQPVPAKKDAPNVIFFILDDVGCGQMSAFGGLVNTPNLDRLVENGLRWTNMHTTAPRSPTRSCVLTARSHTKLRQAGVVTDRPAYAGIALGDYIPAMNSPGSLHACVEPNAYLLRHLQ
jgi:hypothetical protein